MALSLKSILFAVGILALFATCALHFSPLHQASSDGDTGSLSGRHRWKRHAAESEGEVAAQLPNLGDSGLGGHADPGTENGKPDRPAAFVTEQPEAAIATEAADSSSEEQDDDDDESDTATDAPTDKPEEVVTESREEGTTTKQGGSDTEAVVATTTAQPEPEPEPVFTEVAEKATSRPTQASPEIDGDNGDQDGELAVTVSDDVDVPPIPDTPLPPGDVITEVQAAVTQGQAAVTEPQPAVTEPQPAVTEPQPAATEAADPVTTSPSVVPDWEAASTAAASTIDEDLSAHPWIDEGVTVIDVQWDEVQLPTDVIPYHYDLEFHPHIYEGSESEYYVSGKASIHIHCHNPTQQILLHAQGLRLGEITVKSTNNVNETHEPPVAALGFVQEKDILVIVLAEALFADWDYVLTFQYFEAAMDNSDNDVKYGFSAFNYEDEVYGRKVPGKFMMTFCSPAFARKMFPCFDEPGFKTTFTISIVHQEQMLPFSNMPVQHQEQGSDGLMTSYFEKTPPMNTYLVQVMLADQIRCRRRMWHGKRIRVCSRKSQLSRTGHLLEIVPSLIDWMEEFTGVDYPLPKLDYIAVPRKAGRRDVAMEHWGIITANEYQLLYSPEEDLVVSVTWVNKIAAHELAHQWYGNTIGGVWWDDIFIKEGITSFLDVFLQNVADPSWDLETLLHFGMDRNYLWYKESKAGAYSMVPVYEQPSHRNRLFNTQIYYKSMSVMYLVQEVIGEDRTKEVLQGLLQRHLYESGTVEELWESTSEVSLAAGLPDMGHVLKQWMSLAGMPVVYVSQTESGQVVISQERFYSEKPEGTNQTGTVWPIPISYLSSEGHQTELTWLEEQTGELDLVLPSDGWMVLNPRRKGLYRVSYEPAMYAKIANLLREDHTVLDEITRSAIVNDAFAFRTTGQLGWNDLSMLFGYMANETDLLPWLSFMMDLQEASKALVNTSLSDVEKTMLHHHLNSIYETVGWEISEDETTASRYLRMVILTASCHLDHPACIAEALRRHQLWVDQPLSNGIHPDIKPAVFCTASRLLPAGEGPNEEEMSSMFQMDEYYGVPFQC